MSLSSWVVFAKYFVTATDRSINCDTYTDPALCIEGRGPAPGGGFESEVSGGEVYLPSAGVNSFYVGYNVGLSWKIIEDLSLGAGLTMYHLFGVKSYDIDQYSSGNAKAGRNQMDRLIASLSLSYQVHKNVGLSLGLGTDTVRPFGADGKDLVILDFERAPDNITSVSFGVTGSM